MGFFLSQRNLSNSFYQMKSEPEQTLSSQEESEMLFKALERSTNKKCLEFELLCPKTISQVENDIDP